MARRPRQELAGAEPRRTCAADGGIQSRPVGRQYTNQARGGVRMRTSSPSGNPFISSLFLIPDDLVLNRHVLELQKSLIPHVLELQKPLVNQVF